MDSENVLDLICEGEEEVEAAMMTSPPPTPDPMAGIGYWESPGNSPKPPRKYNAQNLEGDTDDDGIGYRVSLGNSPGSLPTIEGAGDYDDFDDLNGPDEDFAHQRSRDGIIVEF